MGENRLMHLVLLIEFAMPSAAVSALGAEDQYPRFPSCVQEISHYMESE